MIKIVERRAIDEVGRLLQREFDSGHVAEAIARNIDTSVEVLQHFALPIDEQVGFLQRALQRKLERVSKEASQHKKMEDELSRRVLARLPPRSGVLQGKPVSVTPRMVLEALDNLLKKEKFAAVWRRYINHEIGFAIELMDASWGEVTIEYVHPLNDPPTSTNSVH
jgi:hypothetical protein